MEQIEFLFRGTGGPVIGILLCMSVIALALSIQKLGQFLFRRVGRHAAAQEAIALWLQAKKEQAYAAVEGDRAPLSVVIRHAIAARDKSGASERAVRDDVTRVATEQLTQLSSYVRVIELIAQTAPLLGLFGTVLGMIEAFGELEAAGAAVDPSRLAGGIWTALMTTAVGLAVAIPFSVISSLLEGKVERERVAIETAATGFLADRISEHGIGAAGSTTAGSDRGT